MGVRRAPTVTPTDYQTVTSATMRSNQVAQPTPGQIGAGADVMVGAITNASSDYAYPMPVISAPELIGRFRFSRGMRGHRGPTPFEINLARTEPNPAGGTAPTYGGSAAMARTAGAPDRTQLDPELHAHATPAELERVTPNGQLPAGAGDRTLFGRLRAGGRTANRRPALGSSNPLDPESYIVSTDVAGAQGYVVPNPRQTFDTPDTPGVGRDPAGRPYVAKAGRPTQDARFDPMRVEISNTRRVLDSDSLPALSDRVRAGAADPRQARPQQQQLAFTTRPFDQAIGQHLTGMKGVVRNPLAARPLLTGREYSSDVAGKLADIHTGQHGWRASTPAPGMTPSGPSANTIRQVPSVSGLDAYVINQPGAHSARRFRG